jgi:cation-transporting ATPase E
MPEQHSLARKSGEIARLAGRHIFLPINAIIFSVVILLVIFGDTQEGLFLGAIVLVNIVLGFGQDVRAWITLEQLQILTALRVQRINADGSETQVLLHEIRKGDELRVRLGDQIPCDSVLLQGGVEINEGLITGESDSIAKKEGEELLAGSVVTSGSGVIRVATPFSESRIAKMTEGLKRYSANPSPIQLSIQKIITYTVYVLLLTIAIVVIRGAFVHESSLHIVENIGALASVLVPQGLVVSVTLLFTFGAAHFYNRHVLLQEVNATEKFGHIKNLCVDKTGTLTENELTVERMVLPPGSDMAEARMLAAAYVRGSADSSQVVSAMERYLAGEQAPDIADTLPFSSWRQYGGVCIPGPKSACILAGAPEAFFAQLPDEERRYLEELLGEETRAGKHVTCLVRAVEPIPSVPRTLAGEKLSLVAVFVQSNKLREGIRGAIDFFQKRGVTIRVLTGDHPETARVVAQAAGIEGYDRVITSAQMDSWDMEQYMNHAKDYVIFARIKPEQKERIIDALKRDGFTAMVGDGANDALSLKKADLGIAMADGASAARQIAAVILTKNSFIELPGGVRLADSMIENIEIFASIFMNQTFVSFLLFAILTIAGFGFPLVPLNISLINYFAVGMPGTLIAYWAIRPEQKMVPVSKEHFLRRVLPLPAALSLIQALAAVGLFAWALGSGYSPAPLLVALFVMLGYLYFLLTPRFHTGVITLMQRIQLAVLGVIELVVLYVAFNLSVVQTFFSVSPPPLAGVQLATTLALLAGVIMFLGAHLLRSYVKR